MNQNPSVALLNLTDYQGFVPESMWGKDHISTLVYAETRAVDYGGLLDIQHMRSDGYAYPSYLKDGVQLAGHTDWDCLLDAENEGLLTVRNRIEVEFTDKGWEYVGKLRRAKAERTKKGQ